MGIVRVMSVKYYRMLFTYALRSPLTLGMRSTFKVICYTKTSTVNSNC